MNYGRVCWERHREDVLGLRSTRDARPELFLTQLRTKPTEENDMQTITIKPEEIEVLRELLRAKINELEVETFRTDAHDFKEMLKHRREVLEGLLRRVSEIPVEV